MPLANCVLVRAARSRDCPVSAAMIARLPILLAAPLWILLSLLATGAHADNGIGDQIEFSGRLSTETRLYPETAAYPRLLTAEE